MDQPAMEPVVAVGPSGAPILRILPVEPAKAP
jgi:hypothetical protein